MADGFVDARKSNIHHRPHLPTHPFHKNHANSCKRLAIHVFDRHGVPESEGAPRPGHLLACCVFTTTMQEGGRRGGGGGDSKTKEDFEDMRLTLQESDYGNFLANEPRLDPKVIGARATAKWVREFKYFRATATGDLARFMDFIAYEVCRALAGPLLVNAARHPRPAAVHD